MKRLGIIIPHYNDRPFLKTDWFSRLQWLVLFAHWVHVHFDGNMQRGIGYVHMMTCVNSCKPVAWYLIMIKVGIAWYATHYKIIHKNMYQAGKSLPCVVVVGWNQRFGGGEIASQTNCNTLNHSCPFFLPWLIFLPPSWLALQLKPSLTRRGIITRHMWNINSVRWATSWWWSAHGKGRNLADWY